MISDSLITYHYHITYLIVTIELFEVAKVKRYAGFYLTEIKIDC